MYRPEYPDTTNLRIFLPERTPSPDYSYVSTNLKIFPQRDGDAILAAGERGVPGTFAALLTKNIHNSRYNRSATLSFPCPCCTIPSNCTDWRHGYK